MADPLSIERSIERDIRSDLLAAYECLPAEQKADRDSFEKDPADFEWQDKTVLMKHFYVSL